MIVKIGDHLDCEDFDVDIRTIACCFTDSIKYVDKKGVIDDKCVLTYFPVLSNTLYSKNKGISEKIAKNKAWIPNNNQLSLLNNWNNYKFVEHSLFLLKEHFKMILKYGKSDDGKILAYKILRKLDSNFVDNEGIKKLNRFLEAQESKNVDKNSIFEQALKEIKSGLKFHCWIRYVFPQMKGLGKSKVTKFYEIDGRYEAELYINHPILRQRLIEATQAILDSDKTVYEIFGDDVMKVRACMLLFASVSDIPEFKKLINKYCWK